MKENFTIREVRGIKAYKVFHLLHIRTCKRLDISPNPISFYKAIQEELCPKYANFFFAYMNGRPVAGVIVLKYKDTVYYYSSAMLSKYRRSQVMSLLLWNIILWAKDKGFKYFDLLFHPHHKNVNSREYGLYLFKRGFGGEEKRVYHYVKVKYSLSNVLWNNILIPFYKFYQNLLRGAI